MTYNWHDAETSVIESALSRGDRRLGDVLETVWRSGGRLDAWSDYFSFERWQKAFKRCGVDPAFYANTEIPTDAVLPWDHIDVGVRKEGGVIDEFFINVAPELVDFSKLIITAFITYYFTKKQNRRDNVLKDIDIVEKLKEKNVSKEEAEAFVSTIPALKKHVSKYYSYAEKRTTYTTSRDKCYRYKS